MYPGVEHFRVWGALGSVLSAAEATRLCSVYAYFYLMCSGLSMKYFNNCIGFVHVTSAEF